MSEQHQADSDFRNLFFRELRVFCARVPDFVPDREDVADQLSYLVYNDLGRFLCDAAYASKWSEVDAAMTFTEALLTDKSDAMRDLVGDFLEGIAECSKSEELLGRLGPRAKALQAYLKQSRTH
jgi:hypothetical protein